MTRRLLVAAGVHTLDPAQTSARAVVVDGGRVDWVGADPRQAPPADAAVDLGDAWVTPAFVDAHVHATLTGLAEDGVDLAGAASLGEAMDRLRRHAHATDAPVVLGHGWDHLAWPEQRPPTAADIAGAAPARTVLLDRVDLHSCVVDPATLDRLPLADLDGVDRGGGGLPTGWLREQAGGVARQDVLAHLSSRQLAEARDAVCAKAASLGIASLHEMGHPAFFGLDDARAWASGGWPVEVAAWWADLDPRAALAEGLHPGGDLFLDGSIGSGTAAVSCGYDAAAGPGGQLFHPDEEVAAFFTACTRAGVGGGVHAIGDRAIEQAVVALEAAADAVGPAAVRACRHRVEHVELPHPGHVRRLAALGVVASVQPGFDAAWGGERGLYARRFGADVARTSNPFAWFAREGLVMAFGSDSTVTPMGAWDAVVAAERHRGGLGLDRRTALAAHTVGGWVAAGSSDAGRLRPGARAHLAVWPADPLSVDDPRLLDCVGLVVSGGVVHGALDDHPA